MDDQMKKLQMNIGQIILLETIQSLLMFARLVLHIGVTHWYLINSNSQLQFRTIMFLLVVLEQSGPFDDFVVRVCA